VPLRPLGLGEMLDGAVGVMRRYPRPTLGMSAAVAVVIALLNVVLLLTVLRPLATFDPTTPLTGDTEQLQTLLGGAAVGGLLGGLLALLASAVLTGILTAVVGKAVLGQPLDVRQAWQSVRPQLWKLVGVSVLIAVLVAAVLFAAVAVAVAVVAAAGAAGPGADRRAARPSPGVLGRVYLASGLSLAPVRARAGEDRGAREPAPLLALGERRLVAGVRHHRADAGHRRLRAVLVQAPFELLGYGGLRLRPAAATRWRAHADRLLDRRIVASTLVEPFTAGVRALLYVDRRMRAEGLDVALAAAAAGRP
jgi:hypothetical protein